MYGLQALLGRYRDACNHVAKRLTAEGVRLKAGRAAAANKAEGVMSHFLRGLVLSTKECVRKHIAQTRTSVSRPSSKLGKII